MKNKCIKHRLLFGTLYIANVALSRIAFTYKKVPNSGIKSDMSFML